MWGRSVKCLGSAAGASFPSRPSSPLLLCLLLFAQFSRASFVPKGNGNDCYAGYDFIRRSRGVPGAAIAIFADRRDRRIKSPISGMSDIGNFNSPAFAKCARSRDFLRLLL